MRHVRKIAGQHRTTERAFGGISSPDDMSEDDVSEEDSLDYEADSEEEEIEGMVEDKPRDDWRLEPGSKPVTLETAEEKKKIKKCCKGHRLRCGECARLVLMEGSIWLRVRRRMWMTEIEDKDFLLDKTNQEIGMDRGWVSASAKRKAGAARRGTVLCTPSCTEATRCCSNVAWMALRGRSSVRNWFPSPMTTWWSTTRSSTSALVWGDSRRWTNLRRNVVAGTEFCM